MSGGSMDRFLNSIPGYAGYRSKEKRRESDRLIRERLAEDYGRLADRLGRLATRYADQRDLTAVRQINKPHTRLVTFRDRLRSATYGYAPLFSDTVIDERALDQIAAFDRSLGEGLEPLEREIAAVESAAPGTAEFTSAIQSLETAVEGLHERFAGRDEVMTSGKALEPEKVAILLRTDDTAELDKRPTAYSLHDGEAVTFAGTDYTVIGRVTVDLPSESWRVFQLKGGTGNEWLRVPASASGAFQWLQSASPDGEMGTERVQIGDTSFERDHEERGTTEVIGPQGTTRSAPVRYLRYRPFSGTDILHVFDWGADSLALRGRTIDASELQLWSREGRDAV